MDVIDSTREKKIFTQRLRHEWLDSFVKRYIQMKGEVGTALLAEEYKRVNVITDVYLFTYEKMRATVASKKANF